MVSYLKFTETSPRYRATNFKYVRYAGCHNKYHEKRNIDKVSSHLKSPIHKNKVRFRIPFLFPFADGVPRHIHFQREKAKG